MPTDNINNDETVPDPEPTVPCHVCGDQMPESEISDEMEVRTRLGWHQVYLCESCEGNVYRCEVNARNCHGWDSDGGHTEQGQACSSCLDYFEYCDYCDEYRRGGCDYCREQEEGLIKPYSYKPAPVFHFVTKMGITTAQFPPECALTIGTELEMGAPDADRDEVALVTQEAFGDLVYLKEDCSVSQYNGFEVVSHPFTLDYLRQLDLEGIMSRITSAGGRAHRFADCGLHAHIGRRLFFSNPTALYRMFSLLYSNESKWQTIGGRGDVHWAKWDRAEHGDVMDYVRHAQAVKTGKRNWNKPMRMAQYNRHVAVNLMNDNTIELRYAKATLNASTLRARYEGYFALAMYSLSTKFTSIRDLGRWEPFIEFASAQKLDTFVQYTEDRGVNA